MTTRAKFKCTEVVHQVGGIRVKMAPVTATNPENTEFFTMTPSGSLEMGIVNQKLIGEFKPGMEFYLDFTPAES